MSFKPDQAVWAITLAPAAASRPSPAIASSVRALNLPRRVGTLGMTRADCFHFFEMMIIAIVAMTIKKVLAGHVSGERPQKQQSRGDARAGDKAEPQQFQPLPNSPADQAAQHRISNQHQQAQIKPAAE